MYCTNQESLTNTYLGQVRHPFIVSDQINKVVICSYNPHSNNPLYIETITRDYFDPKYLRKVKQEMITNYRLAKKKADKLKF